MCHASVIFFYLLRIIEQTSFTKSNKLKQITKQEQEFSAIIEKHKRLIYKIAHTYCNDSEDRKDLVQEIVLQLWKAFPKYNPQFAITTFCKSRLSGKHAFGGNPLHPPSGATFSALNLCSRLMMVTSAKIDKHKQHYLDSNLSNYLEKRQFLNFGEILSCKHINIDQQNRFAERRHRECKTSNPGCYRA